MAMRVALIDYKVVPTNPIGGIHRRMLEGLCYEHDFTVFAVEFDNPNPERIRYVRIPVPSRPLALLYVSYLLIAPLFLWLERIRHGRFDAVHIVESNYWCGDVSRVGFCHKHYIRQHWSNTKPNGWRGVARGINHWLHAMMEPFVYRRTRHLIVPSLGLKRELETEYPFLLGRLTVIANPVDLNGLHKPETFDREAARRSLALSTQDFVLVFVALGHFERKGLPLILEALRHVENAKLVVVGGERDVTSAWRDRVKSMSLDDRVRFVGMQRDVRPFLWTADAFVFPSAYETFSQVTFQAAAASLPLVVTRLHGVEEFMIDGETGFIVSRSAEAIGAALKRLATMPPELRASMGQQARARVKGYSVEAFVDRWRGFYREKLQST
jgi:glycosyltransferase involved in cell wall biosynthesis